MKKLVLVATIGMFLFMLTACGGGGKYADAKKVVEEMITVSNSFFADIEAAEDAQAVANAIDAYAEGMKKMAPKMKEMQEKYPELKDAKDEDMPAELQGVMKDLEESMGKMMSPESEIAKKMVQYATDPLVQEAQKRLMEAMSAMQ